MSISYQKCGSLPCLILVYQKNTWRQSKGHKESMSHRGATPNGSQSAQGTTTIRGAGGSSHGRSARDAPRNPSKFTGRVKFQSPEPELQEYGFISGTSTYRQSLNGIAAWATSSKGLPYEVGAALRDLKEPSLQQPLFPDDADGNSQQIYVYKAD